MMWRLSAEFKARCNDINLYKISFYLVIQRIMDFISNLDKTNNPDDVHKEVIEPCIIQG